MAKKIMIVDDESSVRITVSEILKSENYETSEYPDATAAWKQLESGKDKPDLILLDVMMPGLTPVEFIKKIKADSKLKSIKIIFITAVLGAAQATKDIKGVSGTIEKPFKNEVLLSKIKKVLA